MKKLSLKLDDLCVESFDTSHSRRRTRGTIRGNGYYNEPALDPFYVGGEPGEGGTVDFCRTEWYQNTCRCKTWNAWCCGSGSCPGTV